MVIERSAYIMEGSRRLALPPTPLNPAEPLPLGPNALESGRSAGRGEKRTVGTLQLGYPLLLYQDSRSYP